ncbi:hypothetical protein V6N13_033980 [Hibiscus sabdariffa]
MEGGDIYKANASLRGSLRSGSSSVWRNTGVDVFSRSSRDEDDEEALKWAALEKLPTVARLRKGILTSSQGGANEIDVLDIGWQQRRALLERLVKVAEDDNEKFLLKLKDRIDRVGIDLPTIEVRFQNVNIEAQAFVGTNALPTVVNFMTNIFENLFIEMGILSSRKKKLTILKDVSGIIKPGRMTLLLGPPSSGKTTLLLALAGKLDTALKCSGTVTYNGHEMNEFVPQRTAAYISQHDLHIGEMTVRETLAFSARCQGVGDRYDMLAELSRREKQANIKPDPDIDVFMKILGLEVCADTMVGDEMVRGISGGQKKRVTTGEMLVGPAKALFMDEISTGDIKSWWIWGYWISPIMYGQNALMVNEFRGNQWSHTFPNSTEPAGIEILKSRGFFTDPNWYWIGVGGLIGFTILFNFCFTVALTYLNPFGSSRAVITEETESNEQANGAGVGGSIQLANKESSSNHVAGSVRNTVDTGRTVVCTIHQPSIDIFEAFDELFLMKRGGQEIYVGPLGHHSKHLIKYFEGIQGVSKIKDGYNPATWMLEVTTSAQELSLGVDFTDIYKNSDLYRRNKALIEDLSKPAPGQTCNEEEEEEEECVGDIQ